MRRLGTGLPPHQACHCVRSMTDSKRYRVGTTGRNRPVTRPCIVNVRGDRCHEPPIPCDGAASRGKEKMP